jgi:membrane protein
LIASTRETHLGMPEQMHRPTKLLTRSWWSVLKRTIREYQEDNLTDWAAALTYYAVLSIFPALLVLVALLGLVGEYPRTSDALLRIVGDIGPSSATDTFRKPIEGVIRSKGGAGALVGVGLLGALWSASGYVGAFMRASNVIYEVSEGRPFWKLRPLQILVTIAMTILVALVAIAIVLTGPLAKAVGDVVGLGGAAVTTWSIAKWPVLFLVVLTIIAILYYTSPNVRLSGFRWITPGGVLAVVVWLVASAGFAVYVAAFSSYNKTYGTLGAVIVFLVWLWISNNALLLGAELNAELERERRLVSGQAEAEHELGLPPRVKPKGS